MRPLPNGPPGGWPSSAGLLMLPSRWLMRLINTQSVGVRKDKR